MTFTFRNAICAVPTLAVGGRGYAHLGFSVQAGGKHTIGTQNSIVHLRNGYFELVSVHDPVGAQNSPRRKAIMDFIEREGGGLIGFTLRTDSMANDIERLCERELCYGGPVVAERTTDDGTVYTWKVLRPVPQPCPALMPVVIVGEDPPAESTEHANTVSDIGGVAIATNDPQRMISDYAILLDRAPVDEVRRDDLGARATVFDVSGFRIEILEAVGSGLAQEVLARYGPRPVELQLTAKDLNEVAEYLGLAVRDDEVVVPPILGVGMRMRLTSTM